MAVIQLVPDNLNLIANTDTGEVFLRLPSGLDTFKVQDSGGGRADQEVGEIDAAKLSAALDADGQTIQSADLEAATLVDALDANSQDINNAGAMDIERLSVNQSWLTPETNSLQSIQDLIDGEQNDGSENAYIRLKPGTLYEGDTRLYLDSTIKDGSDITIGGRSIFIDARGAAVNYTGSEMEAVMVQQGNLVPSEPDITDDANDDMAGTIKVLGGSWYGPGISQSDPNGVASTRTAVFRQRPSINVDLKPTAVRDGEHGILVEWYNGWNEGCRWGINHGDGFGGEGSKLPNGTRPRYLIRLAGSASAIAESEWTAGQGGRSSGRQSEVDIPFDSAANESELPSGFTNPVTLWHDHVALHGGKIKLRGFIPKGGTHYKLSGNLALNRQCNLIFECEGGDGDSTAIDIADNTNVPVFKLLRLQSNGTDIIASGNASLQTYNAFGLSEATGNKHAKFNISSNKAPGNRNVWLEFNGPGGFRYGLADESDELALMSRNDVRIIDSDSNRLPVFMGPAIIHGDVENRSIKGTFDEHPSDAANGDQWYITGDGTPSEGFYGQTSGGPTQL